MTYFIYSRFNPEIRIKRRKLKPANDQHNETDIQTEDTFQQAFILNNMPIVSPPNAIWTVSIWKITHKRFHQMV